MVLDWSALAPGSPKSSMGSDADTLTKQSDGRRQRGGIKENMSRFKEQLMG